MVRREKHCELTQLIILYFVYFSLLPVPMRADGADVGIGGKEDTRHVDLRQQYLHSSGKERKKVCLRLSARVLHASAPRAQLRFTEHRLGLGIDVAKVNFLHCRTGAAVPARVSFLFFFFFALWWCLVKGIREC